MIALANVTIRSGAFSLSHVSFTIATGEYAVLMGKSGCGKTTLLEVICGLRRVTSGTISLSGRDVTALAPGERGIGYVPQDLALFPTKTVRQQMELPLHLRGWGHSKINQRVQELAGQLGMDAILARRPHGLSGGEAQRVAIARALSFHPQLLLLDEPLAALDDEIQLEIIDLLRSLQQSTGVTTIHVTHRMNEARLLSNRILKLESGIIKDVQ